MNPKILEALAVTCAATSTEMPEAAVRVIASDLSGYPEAAVLGALVRCRREVSGRLSLAAILERIDDGRPGPEEAWAATPKSEWESVVWTPEWSMAHAAAAPHIDLGDMVPARMAFLETYRKRLAEARANGEPASWEFSRGFELDGREIAVTDAVLKGRISVQRAVAMLPTLEPAKIEMLLEPPEDRKRLSGLR